VAPIVRRLGSVCVGSFLLAEAGLLDGRRATSHWKFSQELNKRYPKVNVVSAPVWVKDGNLYTSAGLSAGIDLALAWVEEDCGNTIATEVARELVLFLRRPAGQAQLSVSLAAQADEMQSIQELRVWIAENLHRELSVQRLAERVAMSVRNFERVFAREVGMSPARYVRQVRVEAAQRMIERSGKGLEQVAAACGFSSADLMRRAFARTLGSTPAISCPSPRWPFLALKRPARACRARGTTGMTRPRRASSATSSTPLQSAQSSSLKSERLTNTGLRGPIRPGRSRCSRTPATSRCPHRATTMQSPVARSSSAITRPRSLTSRYIGHPRRVADLPGNGR
jgi:AraC-like DNA-binding protein